jgi:Zn-dependent protease with chaperone function
MLHSYRRSGSILAFCLLLLLFPGHIAVTFAAAPERIIPNPRDQQRIQEIVNEFMAKLTMAHKVAVVVVPKNPLVVSVEYTDVSSGFLLSVEEDFIGELTQEELEAAIAHELGHVWIFTHRPFLHTELLANQIAQRLVPRSSLVQVYEKVWKRQGTTGDLARFVGD